MNSSQKEINMLVDLAQTTVGEAKKEAIERIIKKLKPFRFALAKRFANKGVEFDDITQQIDLKLLEAILDYDSSKDPFALRHLISRTRNGIWNYYRKEMNYFDLDKKTISLDATRINNTPTASHGSSSEYEYYEFMIQHVEDFDEDSILNQIIIKEELDKLTPHQKEILFMYFVDDMTQYSIAEELQINQANVSRAKKRGIDSIRDSVNPLGEPDDSF